MNSNIYKPLTIFLFIIGFNTANAHVGIFDILNAKNDVNQCVGYFIDEMRGDETVIPEECKREDYIVRCRRVFGGTDCSCCPKEEGIAF